MVLLFARVVLSESCIENPSGGGGGGDYVWPRKLFVDVLSVLSRGSKGK